MHEEDVTIAKVVLAGWTITLVPWHRMGRVDVAFVLKSHNGNIHGHYETRWQAARAAERMMVRGSLPAYLTGGRVL